MPTIALCWGVLTLQPACTGRLTKKERRQTLTEELLADQTLQQAHKRRFAKLQVRFWMVCRATPLSQSARCQVINTDTCPPILTHLDSTLHSLPAQPDADVYRCCFAGRAEQVQGQAHHCKAEDVQPAAQSAAEEAKALDCTVRWVARPLIACLCDYADWKFRL